MVDKPRILIMGEEAMEEVKWDEAPEAPAADLEHYFRPVKLSPLAINEASKIVPVDVWKKYGLHTWLSSCANHVFRKLSTDQYRGTLGVLNYIFEYDADGPVLKTVTL